MLFSNFNPKKTTKLFGHLDNFEFLKKIISSDESPKTLMLTGNKGEGKSTIVNHLMYYFFDKINYNEKENTYNNNSIFYNQFFENLYPNIIYLNGSDYKNIKIDDIREIKKKLNKSPINNNKRFIILDDVETFNVNSLNALLKIIEEPSKSNFFILINNKSKPLLNTIKSRSIEIKIILKNKDRDYISSSLIESFNENKIFEQNLVHVSPGNFLKFNYAFNKHKLKINDKFFTNFNIIIKIFKKEKDFFFKDLLLFLVEYKFQKSIQKGVFVNNRLIEKKLLIFQKINDFFLYNLNQNTLLSFLEKNFLDE